MADNTDAISRNIRSDPDRVAMILVDAFLYGDENAAKKYLIQPRTIRNYRKLTESDPEIAKSYLSKKQILIDKWADEIKVDNIPIAIQESVDYLRRAYRELPATAENVHAVTGSLKILAEIQLTKEVLEYEFTTINQD